jgi:hypothetical protein
MKKAALIVGALVLSLILAWWALGRFRRASAPGAVQLSAPEPSSLYRSKAAALRAQLQTQSSGLAAPAASALLAAVTSGQGSASAPATFAASRPAQAPKPAESLAELDAILGSGDDSDPRLDSDFNALSPEAKRLFRQRYSQAPAEERNARGTIVLLLGGNIDSPEDWAFLRSVLSEPPCQSLQDCARAAPASAKHQEGSMKVTLAYPQLVALKQVEGQLEESRKPGGEALGNTAQEAVRVLRIARASAEPKVANLAAEIANRFGLNP